MLISKYKIIKVIKINKLVVMLLAIFVSSCNKHFTNVKENESNYTLGIDKNNGEVRVFKSLDQDKDFLLYDNDHTLIHTDEVKVIKKYPSLESKDSTEIQELSRLYNHNEFKINASRQTRNPKTRPLCVFRRADTWMCNLVFLAINTSNMPSSLKGAIDTGINMWREANPNLQFHIITVKDGENIPDGTTVIKLYYTNDNSKFAASTIGARPANQGIVYLTKDCDVVDVAHHIGHVLGYVDENVRPQRNNFIQIHDSAIDLVEQMLSIREAVIIERSILEMQVYDNTSPFDRYSIMMTPSYTFNPVIGYLLERGRKPLLTSLTGARIVPKNTRLSAEDVRRINLVYPPIDGQDELRNTCK